jgi:sec-independent protein translocase protein TatB
MFGMGGSEILVILIVALLFLGPDKLPDAATKLSKGIRELRRQTREVQQTIENDTEFGGAIRDLKSALRGDDLRAKVKAAVAPALADVESVMKGASIKAAIADPAIGTIAGKPIAAPTPAPTAAEAEVDASIAAATGADAIAAPVSVDAPVAAVADAPAGPRLPPSVGEPHDPDAHDDDGDAALAQMIRPAGGTIARAGGSDDHG